MKSTSYEPFLANVIKTSEGRHKFLPSPRLINSINIDFMIEVVS